MNFRAFFPVLVLMACLITACNTSNSDSSEVDTPMAATPNVAVPPGARAGTVSETMNSGGYTYVRVEDADGEFWAAAPEFPVSVGESVVVPAGMAMPNYRSNSLDREFDMLYFVQSVQVGNASASAAPLGLPPGHPDPAAATDPGFDLNDVIPVEGGLTVEQIFGQKESLNGQEVTLRGKVVKFNSGILGTNWIHVQDGSGGQGTNDLTVTTDATVSVGDVVLLAGVLGIDKDLGSGYFYPVIVENATITVE